MKNTLFVLAVSFCVLCSCRGIFDKKGTDVYVSDDLRDGFNFYVGNYWVYKDIVSGQTDSFYVTKNHEDMISNTPHNQNDVIRNHYIELSIAQENIAPLPLSSKKGYWSLFLSGTTIRFYGYFKYQNADEYQAGTNSYTISGQTYNNVSVIIKADTNKISNYGSAVNYYDTFYLCPKVGFIRIAMHHPLDTVEHVWELQRYKVF